MKALPGFLRRHRKLLLWLTGLFALFSLAGFLLAPVVLKQQLTTRGSAALRRTVTVGQVRVNPWTCSVTIRSLAIAAHDGAEFAGWDELYVDFSPWASLFRRTWTFGEIRFVRPRARLHREADGTINIADLLPPSAPTANPAPAAAPAQPPALAIDRLRLEHGEFTYADKSRSVPFSTTFGPTSFELVDFTTRPNRAGTYSFAASTEAGERFAWQGSLTFLPLGSAGRLEIADLALPKYSAFHRDLHGLDLLAGRLGVALDYSLDLSGPAPLVRLSHGRISIADLQLAARGSTTPLAKLPLIELSGIAADSAKLEFAAESLLVRDPELSATRQTDGSIDWLALLQPAAVNSPTLAQSSLPAETARAVSSTSTSNLDSGGGGAAGWSATLGTVEIAGATIHLHDLTNPRPVDLTIDQLGFKLTGASTRLDKPVALATTLRWAGAGHIALTGTVTPQPLAADLQLDVADIALRPLDPYIAPFLNVLLTGGSARAKGHLTFALAADGSPDIRWQGDAGLAGFATVDGEFSEPLFGFADLALTNIAATTQPLAVSLDEVAVKEPFAHAIVFPDKRLNLTAILKTSATAPAPASSATVASTSSIQPHAAATGSALSPEASRPSPQITIARVTLSGARFVATDRSVTPAFTTELADFGGTISGLSSEQLARADVDLSGRLGLAPLKVSGKINPLGSDAFTDVKVAFTGIELPPFTPYSGKFAGYTIDKGKLSLDLAYHLSARELAAENKVVVDQFYLGQPVESPDAVKLPLKLALAILRDRDGRILIDLPIRGNLDDPDFKYGKAVMHTLGTLIVKAATAPFAMLGGLFGGGHDLSAVDFASGSAELGEESLARLDGLVKALTERPGLSLEISSLPQPELDLPGLRATQLEALLRARKVRELAATTDTAIDPANIVLTPEEIARYLAALHAERCPPSVAPGTAAPAPSEVAVSTSTAPQREAEQKRRNLLVRTFRRLFVEPPPSGQPAAAAGTGATTAAPATALTPEEIRAQVLATLTPSDLDFTALAAKRAQRIQEYLLAKGQIDTARVFLATGGVPPAAGTSTTPCVVFNLQ